MFFARTPLELHTVRTLAGRGEDIPAARAAVERFEALGDSVHWSDAVDADLAFHVALIEAVGWSTHSPGCTRRWRARSGLCIAQLRPAWHTPAALAEEHRQVLDGILAGVAARRRGADARAPSTRPCATSPAGPANWSFEA